MSTLTDQLSSIHTRIHSRFVYVKDVTLWGHQEHWESPDEVPDEGPLYGDCDCFALACRKCCRELNIPSRLVLCAVDVNDTLVGHLVLEVQGWIFCCNHPDIVPNTSLKYEWIMISGYEQGEPWRYIHPDKDLWSKVQSSS